VAQGPRDKKKKEFAKPDWEYYGQLHQMCLWQAVALLHDIEPNDLLDDDGNLSVWAMPEPCRAKVWIAQNHLQHALPILKLDKDDEGQPSVFCSVELKVFSLWAATKEWAIPPRFPHYTSREIAAKWPNEAKAFAASRGVAISNSAAPAGSVAKTGVASSPSIPAKPAGVTAAVSLPHTTKDLEAVFKVMREYWSDPAKPPRQKDVAAALDKAIGRWSVTKGKSTSREADLVASLLCPDSHKRTRKRGGTP